MRRTKCTMATMLSILLITVLTFSGMTPTAAERTDLENMHLIDGVADLAQEYTILQEPTHSIYLEASQSAQRDMLAADGFANVTFNDDGLWEVILPENLTVATPYFLTLTDAYTPIRDGFEFIGWLHADSNTAISPGQTILINGSGVVNLYALWAFDELGPMLPPPNMETAYLGPECPGNQFFTQEYAILHGVPTHDIYLEASQSRELGMLVADGFANVTFNDDGSFVAILPESLTVATPYFLTLTDAHIPVRDGFEFAGWLHTDSNTAISPRQTILINGSGAVSLYALWAFNENTLMLPPPNMEAAYPVSECSENQFFTQVCTVLHGVPTHDIYLEASQSREHSMLVANGFANVTFNDDGPFISVVPESLTVATPYFLTLTDAHIPIRDGFEFIGWLHADSNIAISPGQTILISGSGAVNLYALWAFNESGQRLLPPNMEAAFQVAEGHEYYIPFPSPETEFGVPIPEYYVDLEGAYNLMDVNSALPRITHAFINGTPRVGFTLTATFSLSSFVSNPVVTYQWQRWNGVTGQWVNIAGATRQTYVPTAADAHCFIVVRVQGTGANVSTGVQFSDWVEVSSSLSNIAGVEIGGILRVGSTLTANVIYIRPFLSAKGTNKK